MTAREYLKLLASAISSARFAVHLSLALTGVTVTSSTYESDNTTRRPAEGPVFSICTCVLDLLVLLLLAVVHNL